MAKRFRRLWLGIKVNKIPRGISRGVLLDALRESIASGTYDLPPGWDITLLWRNTIRGQMKAGTWSEELYQSRHGVSGSEGFDKAVLEYIERQRNK